MRGGKRPPTRLWHFYPSPIAAEERPSCQKHIQTVAVERLLPRARVCCAAYEHALRSLNGVLQPALSEHRVVVCVTGVLPPLALRFAATTGFLVWQFWTDFQNSNAGAQKRLIF